MFSIIQTNKKSLKKNYKSKKNLKKILKKSKKKKILRAECYTNACGFLRQTYVFMALPILNHSICFKFTVWGFLS